MAPSAPDPERPALEYLTLDQPRFLVNGDWDSETVAWEIDEPGLYVVCRICGIPVARLTYESSFGGNMPERVWGLDRPPGPWFQGAAIGDISAPGEGSWTWDAVIAEIRDRLAKTSLAGAGPRGQRNDDATKSRENT